LGVYTLEDAGHDQALSLFHEIVPKTRLWQEILGVFISGLHKSLLTRSQPMKSRSLIILLVVAAVLLAACGGMAARQPSEVASFAVEERARDASAAAMEAESAASISDDTLAKVNLQNQAGPDRLIIRNGDLSVVVEDTDAAAADIAQLAGSLDGWLVSSDLFESSGYKRGSVTIRIPAERFDAAVEQIKAMALEVRTESTSSQDVTEEYVDLESRLANLEATADRVRGFLDEARNVEDALDVNRELSSLESDIEVIKGRMQYLSQSAAYSTLTVNLIPDEISQPVEIGGWRPEGVAKDAIEALVSTLQTLADAAIWAGIFCLPLVVLAGVPLFFIGRAIYRRRQRGKLAPEAPAATAAAEAESPDESQ
jgi:hypothetical protein